MEKDTTMQIQTGSQQAIDEYRASGLGEFVTRCIEGPMGMNSFEEHEMVIWHVSDRVAAADYIIRCLANPDCPGSQDVLNAIHAERRRQLSAKSKAVRS